MAAVTFCRLREGESEMKTRFAMTELRLADKTFAISSDCDLSFALIVAADED